MCRRRHVADLPLGWRLFVPRLYLVTWKGLLLFSTSPSSPLYLIKYRQQAPRAGPKDGAVHECQGSHFPQSLFQASKAYLGLKSLHFIERKDPLVLFQRAKGRAHTPSCVFRHGRDSVFVVSLFLRPFLSFGSCGCPIAGACFSPLGIPPVKPFRYLPVFPYVFALAKTVSPWVLMAFCRILFSRHLRLAPFFFRCGRRIKYPLKR